MKQSHIICVREKWGYLTGSRVINPNDLNANYPSVDKARKLVKNSPQGERPLLFNDLTALAAAIQRAGIDHCPIAIYRPRWGHRGCWSIYQFNSAN